MLFGIILIAAGGVLGWMVNWILGTMSILAGVAMIGMQVLNSSGPEIEFRRYDGGSKTYEINSAKPKPRR